MKHTFQFIFNDGNLGFITHDDTLGLHESEFINNLIDCNSQENTHDVKNHNNIRINFSKSEFDRFIKNEYCHDLFDINLFFGNTKGIINTARDAVADKTALERTKIFNRNPNIYFALKNHDCKMLNAIKEHQNKFYEVSKIKLFTDIELLQKKYGTCATIIIVEVFMPVICDSDDTLFAQYFGRLTKKIFNKDHENILKNHVFNTVRIIGDSVTISKTKATIIKGNNMSTSYMHSISDNISITMTCTTQKSNDTQFYDISNNNCEIICNYPLKNTAVYTFAGNIDVEEITSDAKLYYNNIVDKNTTMVNYDSDHFYKLYRNPNSEFKCMKIPAYHKNSEDSATLRHMVGNYLFVVPQKN